MTKKRIRIGQIGIGHNHGADKMIALRALTDDFEVIGVTENDPVWYEKRKNLPSINAPENYNKTSQELAEMGYIHDEIMWGEDIDMFK